MTRLLTVICTLFVLTLSAAAQQDSPADLTLSELETVETVGDFGQPISQVRGVVTNDGEAAYANLSFSLAAFDRADTQVGEGIGYAVDACGAGLVFDYALQPGESQPFLIPLERLDENARIDRLDVTPFADAIDPLPVPELADGVTRIAADQEAVSVEWVDANSLRFGIGCRADLFSEWAWFVYNVRNQTPTPRAHPYADAVTPELAENLLLTQPGAFDHSALSFAPDGDRVVYQDPINTFLTAGQQGFGRRLLYLNLSRFSLQGIYWQPDERFLAYYYGAYGDPVYYFTATAEAVPISPFVDDNQPSITVPGVSRDARRVVVTGDFGDGLGYYLHVVTNNFFEKLFDATPPGNNYPSPLLLSGGEDDLITRVYLALDDENGEPRLYCFNREQSALIDLAPLPFRLSTAERAQWWLSPDDRRIALAVSAARGGLWMIDLEVLPACHI
jgi:hypothetical protein